MIFKETIINELARAYHGKFNVDETTGNGLKIITVSPYASANNYFEITVQLKDKTRMIISCEPQKYGAEFVDVIHSSSYQQRLIFTQYWAKLNTVGKTSLKINEIPFDEDSFISDTNIWNKFFFRFTMAPYFDADKNENEIEIVAKYVVVVCGMILSLVSYEIEGSTDGYEEGKAHLVQSKKYERNPLNRELCLLEKGYLCSVCEFDFEKYYGNIGKEFIHVHHSVPISAMGDNYVVNPSEELFPVCPNCHAMLHKNDPPYTIEELKKIIEKTNRQG